MKVKSMAKNTSKAEKKGALSIKNVTKIYDPTGVNVMAVDDCSMEIAGGEVCMIVGPNNHAYFTARYFHGAVVNSHHIYASWIINLCDVLNA